LYRRKHTH